MAWDTSKSRVHQLPSHLVEWVQLGVKRVRREFVKPNEKLAQCDSSTCPRESGKVHLLNIVECGGYIYINLPMSPTPTRIERQQWSHHPYGPTTSTCTTRTITTTINTTQLCYNHWIKSSSPFKATKGTQKMAPNDSYTKFIRNKTWVNLMNLIPGTAQDPQRACQNAQKACQQKYIESPKIEICMTSSMLKSWW